MIVLLAVSMPGTRAQCELLVAVTTVCRVLAPSITLNEFKATIRQDKDVVEVAVDRVVAKTSVDSVIENLHGQKVLDRFFDL